MNIDPLAEDYVYNSPYNFSENRVIDGIELEGLEWTDADGKEIAKEKLKDVKIYLFYEKGATADPQSGVRAGEGGFKEQTIEQYNHYTEKYGEGSVAMSTGENFVEDWVNMSGDDIREVKLNYHGDSQWVGTSNGGNLSSVGNTTAELGNNAVDINKLPLPSGDISGCHLQINSCSSNGETTRGLNVFEAFKNNFFKNNKGFYSISGASGGVSYPLGRSAFGYGTFKTNLRPTIENWINSIFSSNNEETE